MVWTPLHSVLLLFLSTLPARGATRKLKFFGKKICNFYPRSPRGERPWKATLPPQPEPISIHAPREGSDKNLRHVLDGILNFYPRSPRGERRPALWMNGDIRAKFLSTLPARGATGRCGDPAQEAQEISIHAPREGSDAVFWAACTACTAISIHAPREGSDPHYNIDICANNEISIHAPREGSDLQPGRPARPAAYFYPRSPRGERPIWSGVRSPALVFLSTLPARGATETLQSFLKGNYEFLSTLPARGATFAAACAQKNMLISIHAPREGSDLPTTQAL